MDLGQVMTALVDVDGSGRIVGEHTTYGNTKFHSMRISIAFGGRIIAMGDRKYASTLTMPELWN